MTQEMEQYLSKVRLWMFGMPRKAKNGIITELRAHVIDSSNAQGGPASIGYVVSQMESPRKTAKRYKQIYGYGLPMKILFVVVTIFLSIWTVPVWEVVNPSFSTTFVFLILIIFLFFVGSRAGRGMALATGISSLLTRFIILGLVAAALGENAVVQGGGAFVFLLASILLILVAYLPARTLEKWDEKRAWDIPMQTAPQPYPPPPYPNPRAQPAPYPPQPSQQHNPCPRCGTPIFAATKFCPECGTRVV